MDRAATLARYFGSVTQERLEAQLRDDGRIFKKYYVEVKTLIDSTMKGLFNFG